MFTGPKLERDADEKDRGGQTSDLENKELQKKTIEKWRDEGYMFNIDDGFEQNETYWNKLINVHNGDRVDPDYQELGIEHDKLKETDYWFPGMEPSSESISSEEQLKYIGTVGEFGTGRNAKVIGHTNNGYVVVMLLD